MSLKKVFLLFFCLVFITSCLHVTHKIQDLPPKATKTYILKILGKPFKIQRKEGRDYWVYKFIIDGRHYTQTVIISDGTLYKKGKIKPYPIRPF